MRVSNSLNLTDNVNRHEKPTHRRAQNVEKSLKDISEKPEEYFLQDISSHNVLNTLKLVFPTVTSCHVPCWRGFP